MSIELKNVTYTYSPGTSYEIHALKDINLEVRESEFVVMVGPSGCGKSTLINIIGGLEEATEGEV